jgi:cytochrome c-type biogenesis protein
MLAAAHVAGPVGLLVAFAAGLASFLSPCVLPLVPSYVAFLAGTGAGEERPAAVRAPGIAFVLGFSAVFVLLGLTASALGQVALDNAAWLARIGGVLLVLFGLHLLHLLRLPLLDRDTRQVARAARRPLGILGAFLVGAAFAAGWTPCIGPVLAAILALAATSGSLAHGTLLLVAYSAGLAVPFLLAMYGVQRWALAAPRLRTWMPWIERISGVFLIVLGLLLASGTMARLSAWAARFTPGWLG